LRAILPERKFENLGPGNPYTDGGYHRDDPAVPTQTAEPNRTAIMAVANLCQLTSLAVPRTFVT
jgi:hypothetical protein